MLHKSKNGQPLEKGSRVMLPATVVNIRNEDSAHKGAGIVVQLDDPTPNGDRPSIAVHGNQVHVELPEDETAAPELKTDSDDEENED